MSAGLHPVRGHEALRGSLANATLARSLPATLLLHGPRGAGKQRLGLWIAQLLLCGAPTPAGPCDACRACRLALRLEHPDLHWYFPLPRPTGASSPQKLADALEEARGEALAALRTQPLRASASSELRGIFLAAAQSMRRRAQRRPSEGDVQVFLVGDAETLVPQESSPEAANALLKLLEEPPEGTRFVLTSSEPGRLLPTIRSRSLPIHVPGLPTAEVERFLVEVGAVAADEARRAARLSHGCIGRALGYLPQQDEAGPLETRRGQAFELIAAALAPSAAECARQALGQGAFGARGLSDLFDALEEWLRDLAAAKGDAAHAVLHQDAGGRLAGLADRMVDDPAAPLRARTLLDEARLQTEGNVNPQLVIAGLLGGLRRVLLAPAAPVGARG